ncbi:MAG: hypothetical protein JOZ92_03455 [Candidatus Dormibacteraeota bacterium]|nr:hypothetical protein [Candidatus Dormibacteraeota bacterium]
MPPTGAAFYPYWTLENTPGYGLAGLRPTGTPCVWNFGNTIANAGTTITTDTFSGDAQYGSPDLSHYGGTLITGGSATSTVANPADGHGNGGSGTCSAITQSQLSYSVFSSLDQLDSHGLVGSISPTPGTYPTTAATLSGAPTWRGLALRHAGAGGYAVDGDGTVTAFGGAPAATGDPSFPFDLARGIVLLPDDSGGYVLDAWGGIHPFATGTNSPPPAVRNGPYWKYWDIARGIVLDSAGTGGYVLDGWGGIQPFSNVNTALPRAFTNGPYWKYWDIARSLVLEPGTADQGWVIDGFGGIHSFDGAPAVGIPYYYNGYDIFRTVAAN